MKKSGSIQGKVQLTTFVRIPPRTALVQFMLFVCALRTWPEPLWPSFHESPRLMRVQQALNRPRPPIKYAGPHTLCFADSERTPRWAGDSSAPQQLRNFPGDCRQRWTVFKKGAVTWLSFLTAQRLRVVLPATASSSHLTLPTFPK